MGCSAQPETEHHALCDHSLRQRFGLLPWAIAALVYNEQVGIVTLEIVFTNAVHIRGFMQPETEDHALYDHFRHDSFGLASGGGDYSIISLLMVNVRIKCYPPEYYPCYTYLLA